jgi:hypothetical protein
LVCKVRKLSLLTNEQQEEIDPPKEDTKEQEEEQDRILHMEILMTKIELYKDIIISRKNQLQLVDKWLELQARPAKRRRLD